MMRSSSGRPRSLTSFEMTNRLYYCHSEQSEESFSGWKCVADLNWTTTQRCTRIKMFLARRKKFHSRLLPVICRADFSHVEKTSKEKSVLARGDKKSLGRVRNQGRKSHLISIEFTTIVLDISATIKICDKIYNWSTIVVLNYLKNNRL